MQVEPSRVSQLLINWSNGDKRALNELMPVLYHPLRKLAHRHLQRERRDHTLQSAALVHEAYLRLLGGSGIHFAGQSHFFAVAAQIMRHILVEHAGHHQAAKRGGGTYKLALEQTTELGNPECTDLVALDDALRTLKVRSATGTNC